jgi:hypothetical protein
MKALILGGVANSTAAAGTQLPERAGFTDVINASSLKDMLE